MSGHSKWATIHRQKGVKDAKRGALFSKLARAITIAAKLGSGPDPGSNFKLRMAIDRAKAENMPKSNIERAIASAEGSGKLEEVIYEGFGPEGIAVMMEVTTDNRNRTGQEIKNIFERGGGHMGGPGAVAHNFEQKAYIEIKKVGNGEEQILNLIDLGVEEVEDVGEVIDVYTDPSEFASKLALIKEKGFEVLSSELTQKPVNYQEIQGLEKTQKVLTFLDSLAAHEDVQKVHSNVEIRE